jgi:hypothetical protein
MFCVLILNEAGSPKLSHEQSGYVMMNGTLRGLQLVARDWPKPCIRFNKETDSFTANLTTSHYGTI